MSDPPSTASSRVNDCWNKIGVRGDATCPELKQCAHCRNCTVYARAAVSLLARDPPADYISEWTEHFARQNQIGESNTHSVLIFRLGPECYSLPTAVCDEVAELRKIHTLPNRRSTAVLGLVNVRGELIICVSIRRMLGVGEPRLQQPQRDGTATERLVVFRDKDGRIAFPVDEVLTSHRYHPLELKPGPATVAKAAAAFTRGVLSWGDRLIGHLDHQIIIEMAKRSIT